MADPVTRWQTVPRHESELGLRMTRESLPDGVVRSHIGRQGSRAAKRSPLESPGSRSTVPEARSVAWPEDELFGHALHNGTALELVHANGHRHPLAVHRWLAEPDLADETLLSRCSGLVLDVGCGPGRFAIALNRRGFDCLGIDVTQRAVDLACEQGARAICCSVFDPLPKEGLWDTVLLADGNLGIAGDPDRLLERVAELLRPGGRLLLEVVPQDVDEVVPVQLSNTFGSSETFHWAHVGPPAAIRRASAAGLSHLESWESDGRVFASFCV